MLKTNTNSTTNRLWSIHIMYGVELGPIVFLKKMYVFPFDPHFLGLTH